MKSNRLDGKQQKYKNISRNSGHNVEKFEGKKVTNCVAWMKKIAVTHVVPTKK